MESPSLKSIYKIFKIDLSSVANRGSHLLVVPNTRRGDGGGTIFRISNVTGADRDFPKVGRGPDQVKDPTVRTTLNAHVIAESEGYQCFSTSTTRLKLPEKVRKTEADVACLGSV
jgi:hypothetical protein